MDGSEKTRTILPALLPKEEDIQRKEDTEQSSAVAVVVVAAAVVRLRRLVLEIGLPNRAWDSAVERRNPEECNQTEEAEKVGPVEVQQLQEQLEVAVRSEHLAQVAVPVS